MSETGQAVSADQTLLKILAACERTAAAVERFVSIAEERQQARQASNGGGKRAKELLSVTGFVLNFGPAAKPTKKGDTYYNLKLSNGFEACVFSETQARLCDRAASEGLPLIIDYENDGKYSNIESVKLGAAPTRAAMVDEDEVPF
jgi:hypothetical protein